MQNADQLFLPKEEREYSLLAMMHLFASRLSTDPEVFMRLPEDVRDDLFKLEMEVIKKEAQAQKTK